VTQPSAAQRLRSRTSQSIKRADTLRSARNAILKPLIARRGSLGDCNHARALGVSALALQVASCDVAQFLIDERCELIECRLVAVSPGSQQPRNVAGGGRTHKNLVRNYNTGCFTVFVIASRY
jgi:hypothetical protein